MEMIDKKDKDNFLVSTTIDHVYPQLTEKSWEIAKKRQTTLEQLLSFDEIPKAKVKEVYQELNICRSSFFRLIKKNIKMLVVQ
ncbi:hypothetical protein ACWNT8_13380 [Pigmentibacter ruber]|nr:hypothetical protein GTC16762_13210 [Pigmentibacter ruber]